MSDPRVVGPQNRSANLSDLMKAKGRASLGEKVNFCPFEPGEEGLEHLDGQGYCEHLVGFTVPGDKTVMERMISDERGRKHVLGSRMEAVLKTDRLVRITTSYRVYRASGGAPSEDETSEVEAKPKKSKQ